MIIDKILGRKKRNKTEHITIISKSSKLNVHQYYSFLKTIFKNLGFFKKSDLIITCAMTYEIVAKLFSKETIVIINTPYDLYKLFVDNQHSKFNKITILSPELNRFLVNNNSLFIRLQQLCSNELIMISEPNIDKLKEFLLISHATGFYQIHTYFSKKDYIISKNHSPDGAYSYFSSTPIFYFQTNNWLIHKLHRVANVHSQQYWQVCYGYILEDKYNKFISQSGVYSLAIKEDCFISFLNIEAEFSWDDNARANCGHSSLVSCYYGPGDTYMYALQVGLDDKLNPIVSLYKNNNSWHLLAQKVLLKENLMPSGKLRTIKLWFETTKTHLKAGFENNLLFDIQDMELERSPHWGLRFSDNDISISNIKIQKC